MTVTEMAPITADDPILAFALAYQWAVWATLTGLLTGTSDGVAPMRAAA